MITYKDINKAVVKDIAEELVKKNNWIIRELRKEIKELEKKLNKKSTHHSLK